MKNLKPILLTAWLVLGSFSNASFAEIFMPLKVGGTMIMIPIGPIQESEESSKTPLGDDEDNDGVRDDVQQNIIAKYGTNSPIANQSLDIARKYQKILSGNLTAQQINQQIADAEYLNACIQNTTGTNTDGLGYVVPLQLNTVERSRAYLTAARDAYHEAGPPSYKKCGNSATSKSKLKEGASKINAPDLSDYDVYFINGVRTNELSAWEMKQRLESLLAKNPVELLWNKNDAIGQFLDLVVEKIGEVNVDKSDISDFWIYVLRGDLPAPISNAIWWATQRWLDPNRDVGYWSEQDLEDMIERIRGSLESNRKTLVVSHSQGNFFYRNIWQAIDQWDTDKTEQCFAGIGIAPPLSSKPGNFDYITNSNDLIINKVREYWPFVLQSNVTVPKDYNGDKNGHGMLKTYMDHPAPLKRFETELKQAVKQIDESCVTSEYFYESGGTGQHKFKHIRTDTSAKKLQIEFDALSIEDGLHITANGYAIASTAGTVSGNHIWDFNYDPKKHGSEFIISVNAPYDSTGWHLCIDYESQNCGKDAIPKKAVYFTFKDTNHWQCDNHTINGQPVSKNGFKELTVGTHHFDAYCTCEGFFCYDPTTAFPYISVSGTECEFFSNNKPECNFRGNWNGIVLEIK